MTSGVRGSARMARISSRLRQGPKEYNSDGSSVLRTRVPPMTPGRLRKYAARSSRYTRMNSSSCPGLTCHLASV